ncbi:MAG: hypothetical protein NPMRth3_920001, partial [Nitrosopumilales archaeon]
MNIIDKSILSAIFASTMTQEDPIEIVKNRTHLSDNIINEKIDGLKKNGLVENDKLSLTDLGRTSLRVILAGGVFDIIHPGHIHTLNAAKAL